MAKIVEDAVLIRFSKIAKDSEADNAAIAGTDILHALEQVAQELVGEYVIVEVMKP